jgi:hypothetical protein
MMHMALKYAIRQIGRSWCLNDRLDLSNHTRSINKKIEKRVGNLFSFKMFENPLYFLDPLQYFPIPWYQSIPIKMVAKPFCIYDILGSLSHPSHL